MEEKIYRESEPQYGKTDHQERNYVNRINKKAAEGNGEMMIIITKLVLYGK